MSRTYGITAEVESTSERGFPMITARSSNGLSFPVAGYGRASGPGEMRLELPSGSYTLIASTNNSDGLQYGETRVTVTDHDVPGVVLRLARVAPIPVDLAVDPSATSDNASPAIQQLGLIFESMQDSLPGDSFQSGSAGLTTLQDKTQAFRLAPGSYRLQARNTGAWYVKSASYGTTDLLAQEMTVAPGAGAATIRVTVSDKTGALNGTVSLNGVPAACYLYLVPSGPSASTVLTVRSANDGSYSFLHLPPGTYRAIAFETRHSANYRDPKALEGFSTYVQTLMLEVGDKATLNLEAVADSGLKP